jgi:hypothetical protein
MVQTNALSIVYYSDCYIAMSQSFWKFPRLFWGEKNEQEWCITIFAVQQTIVCYCFIK